MADHHVQVEAQRVRLLAALRRSPRNPDLHDTYANFLIRERRKDKEATREAIRHFELAVRHDPFMLEARNRLALLLKDRGKVEAAVELLQQCISLAPHYCRARRNLGLLWEGSGRPGDALAMYQEAVRLDPNDTATWVCMGSLHEGHFGDHAKARECFEMAAAVDAHNSEAVFAIASDFARRGVATMARDLLQRCVDVSPDAIKYHCALARLLHQDMKCTDAAIRAYLAALQCPSSATQWRACHDELKTLLRAAPLEAAEAAAVLEHAGSGPRPRLTQWSVSKNLRASPGVSESGVRCSLGHRMLLLHRPKPYIGRATWSCNICAMSISSNMAEAEGVLHCPPPCESDFCPGCHSHWRRLLCKTPAATEAALKGCVPRILQESGLFAEEEARGGVVLAPGRSAAVLGVPTAALKSMNTVANRRGGSSGKEPLSQLQLGSIFLPVLLQFDAVQDLTSKCVRASCPVPRQLRASTMSLYDVLGVWRSGLLRVGDLPYHQGLPEVVVRAAVWRIFQKVNVLGHEKGLVFGQLSLTSILVSPAAFFLELPLSLASSASNTEGDLTAVLGAAWESAAETLEVFIVGEPAVPTDASSEMTTGPRGSWLFQPPDQLQTQTIRNSTRCCAINSEDAQTAAVQEGMFADTYALGLVFAALLTGAMPWALDVLLPKADPIIGNPGAKISNEPAPLPHERRQLADFTDEASCAAMTVAVLAGGRARPYDLNLLTFASTACVAMIEQMTLRCVVAPSSLPTRPLREILAAPYFAHPVAVGDASATTAAMETPDATLRRVALSREGLRSRMCAESAATAIESLQALAALEWPPGVSLSTAWVVLGNALALEQRCDGGDELEPSRPPSSHASTTQENIAVVTPARTSTVRVHRRTLRIRLLQFERNEVAGWCATVSVDKLYCYQRALTEGTDAIKMSAAPDASPDGVDGAPHEPPSPSERLERLPSLTLDQPHSNEFSSPITANTPAFGQQQQQWAGGEPLLLASAPSVAAGHEEVAAVHHLRIARGSDRYLSLRCELLSRRAALQLLHTLSSLRRGTAAAAGPCDLGAQDAVGSLSLPVADVIWRTRCRIDIMLGPISIIPATEAAVLADVATVAHESLICVVAERVLHHLATLHARGQVMHAVAPASIFVCGEPSIRAVQCGLATISGDGALEPLTLAFPPPGLATTPPFNDPRLPPPPVEMSTGKVTAKTDVYMLAVLLLQLFRGKEAYDTRQPINRGATDEPLHPGALFKLPRLISAPFRDFLKAALHPDPSQRPTVTELLKCRWMRFRTEHIAFPEQLHRFAARRSRAWNQLVRVSQGRGEDAQKASREASEDAAVSGDERAHDVDSTTLAHFLRALTKVHGEGSRSSNSRTQKTHTATAAVCAESSSSGSSDDDDDDDDDGSEEDGDSDELSCENITSKPANATHHHHRTGVPSKRKLLEHAVARIVELQQRAVREERTMEEELIPWLLRADGLIKTVVHVEGFSDILFYSALLAAHGLEPFRDTDSRPDEVRYFRPATAKDTKASADRAGVELRFVLNSSASDPRQLVDTLSAYSTFAASTKRFIYFRDNDLKFVTSEKANGAIVAETPDLQRLGGKSGSPVGSGAALWVYHQRLRWGRAIENYILPPEAPLALITMAPQKDTLAAEEGGETGRQSFLLHRFISEALALISKNFFPSPLSVSEWTTTVGDGVADMVSDEGSPTGRRAREHVVRVAKYIARSSGATELALAFIDLARLHRERPFSDADAELFDVDRDAERVQIEEGSSPSRERRIHDAMRCLWKFGDPAVPLPRGDVGVREGSRAAELLVPEIPFLPSFLVPLAAASIVQEDKTASRRFSLLPLVARLKLRAGRGIPTPIEVAATRLLSMLQEAFFVLSLGSAVGEEQAAAFSLVLAPCPSDSRTDNGLRGGALPSVPASMATRNLLDSSTAGDDVMCLRCGASLSAHASPHIAALRDMLTEPEGSSTDAKEPEGVGCWCFLAAVAVFGSYAFDSHPLFAILHGEGYLGKSITANRELSPEEGLEAIEALTQQHVNVLMSNLRSSRKAPGEHDEMGSFDVPSRCSWCLALRRSVSVLLQRLTLRPSPSSSSGDHLHSCNDDHLLADAIDSLNLHRRAEIEAAMARLVPLFGVSIPSPTPLKSFGAAVPSTAESAAQVKKKDAKAPKKPLPPHNSASTH